MNVFLSNSTAIFAGGEDYVLTLSKHLQKRGHNIWVSANPGHLLLSKCVDAGIETVPIAYTEMSRLFSVASETRKHLQRLSIDIIQSNSNYDRTSAAIAAAWSGTRHVACVHSAHSIQHNITHWLRNRFGIAHFVAVADVVKTVLVNEDGIPEQKITFIPNGVEEPPHEKRAAWREKTRAQFGVSADTCVVGNVARLVPFKGHRYLLEAIALVIAQQKNVLFVIAGDGELMSTLQEQARTLKIENAVRLLGFRDDLHEIYPACDIYCHSSLDLKEEAFPIAILKAMATGLPIVSTLVGGIGSMVEQGVTGCLVPPENPRLLADALLNVMRDSGLRASMGTSSFGLFQQKFHASLMAERTEEVYEKVLD